MSRTTRLRVPPLPVGDVLLAALFVAAAEFDIWVRGTVEGPRLTNAVLLAFVAPPLAVRRRWPAAAVAATSVAIAVQAAVVGKPPSGFLYWPILIVSYSLGAHASSSRREWSALAGLVLSYAYVTAVWTAHGSVDLTAVPWLLAAVLPWLLGRYMRGRRAHAAALVAGERREREREQHRLAALEEERTRMARELHDILAHSVSLMGVQAGAAERVLDRDPERARPVLRSIQQASRDSVAELRRLLGMLRADELESDRAPQPRLDQLADLVQRVRDAGVPIELRIEGTAHQVAAGIELTAYRVVQEALTNVLKHARPTHVEVVLGFGAERLDVTVTNDGATAAMNGNGHGLIGMNERVSLYGGRLSAGPRPGGTFHVAAEIPTGADSG